MTEPPISILKALWSRKLEGGFEISSLKSLTLECAQGYEPDYFAINSRIELMTHSPSQNIQEALSSFGPTDFLLKQSIFPVVYWIEGASKIECIGTATAISCSGYIMTAAHVLMHPVDKGQGEIDGNGRANLNDDVNLGIIIPSSEVSGLAPFRFLPFTKMWFWGEVVKSPLPHEKNRFKYLTDIAICKVPELPEGAAHQPLNLSLNSFSKNEVVYSLGFAEMNDISLRYRDGQMAIDRFDCTVYASVGKVVETYPENHLSNEVPTPGPCFNFNARIPGKMSGAPLFGANGAVIRAVVSRSWSGERDAYGSELAPVMQLPLNEPGIENRTLKSLIESGKEGMTQLHGAGL